MTMEEKSKELIDKFSFPYISADGRLVNAVDAMFAKWSALLCCDEIIKELESTVFNYDMDYRDKDVSPSKTTIPYWQSIKQYIQTL